MRDPGDPVALVATWLSELQRHVEGRDGPALVAWAKAAGALAPHTATPSPGDLLVFDRAVSAARSDLVGVAIARDERGVIEFIYAGGGVIRRGFLDPTRPATRRIGGRVVNTFLRHGKQWPPKGTRYLAGELLAHVIRVR